MHYRRRIAPQEKGVDTLSLSSPGLLACVRAHPFLSLRLTLHPDFVAVERKLSGMEPLLAARCLRCHAAHANARYAVICHSAGGAIPTANMLNVLGTQTSFHRP